MSLSSDFKPAAFDCFEPVDGASGIFAILHDMSSAHSSIALTGSKAGSYWKPSFYYANVTTSFDDIPNNNGVIDEGGDGGGGSSNLSTGAIVGIVAGVVVVSGFFIWWCRLGPENAEEKGGDGRFEEHKGEYLDPDDPEVIRTYQDQLQGELEFSQNPRPNFTTTIVDSSGAEEPSFTMSNWKDKKIPYPQGVEQTDRTSSSSAAGTRAPQTIQRSKSPISRAVTPCIRLHKQIRPTSPPKIKSGRDALNQFISLLCLIFRTANQNDHSHSTRYSSPSAMDQAVFQTLTDTLSADPNARMAAELRIKELQQNPGTTHAKWSMKMPLHRKLIIYGWEGMSRFCFMLCCLAITLLHLV